MKRYALLMLISLTWGFGQSIMDLMQKSGAEGSDIMKLQEQAGPSDGPDKIPSEVPITEVVKILQIPDDSETLEYFGYAYFSNRGELAFLDNLPAPANYQVGAGDEIIITIWGETQLRETSQISRDGNIYFENVGLVNMVNLSFDQAKQVLRSRFENVYSTLRGGSKATTYMEISLGALKSINIHFLGEVKSPGVMPIHPFSTVTTGLLQAGGVSLIGSLRDIQIIRNGQVLKRIDYYQYLQEGAIDNNIRLADNDVISIPVRKSTIHIKGQVKRPGIFELKTGETLKDLIQFAGGLENDAESKIEIKRVLPMQYRKTDSENIQRIWVDYSQDAELVMLDGDNVNVFPLFMTDQTVHIEGQVKNPGEFSLSTDMRLTDLLEISGGIFSIDHWKKVYPFRADLIRSNRYESTSQIIPIMLDKLKQDDASQNLALQDGDRVIIYPTELNKYFESVEIFGDVRNPGEYMLDVNMGLTDLILRAGGFSYSAYPAEVAINSITPFAVKTNTLSTEKKVKVDPSVFNKYPELDNYKLKNKDQVFVRKYPEFQFQRNIFVEGEVKFPGVYALEEKGEKLASVIKRAGNLTEESFIEGLRIVRNEKRLILERKGKNEVDLNLPLLPGDHIFIPKHSYTVEIIGNVNSPGLVQYRKGLSLKDYIKIAGNYTQDGDKQTVAVYYANGESKSRFLFFYPKIREDSQIVVYKKPIELPLDKTAFLTEISTVVVQALSLILVADKLAN